MKFQLSSNSYMFEHHTKTFLILANTKFSHIIIENLYYTSSSDKASDLITKLLPTAYLQYFPSIISFKITNDLC